MVSTPERASVEPCSRGASAPAAQIPMSLTVQIKESAKVINLSTVNDQLKANAAL